MNETGQKAPSDGFRERLLDAMLEIAAETGWTEAALARAAHTLKGSVGILSDEGPTATVRRIEMAARAVDWSVARTEFPKLKHELGELRLVLTALLESPPQQR